MVPNIGSNENIVLQLDRNVQSDNSHKIEYSKSEFGNLSEKSFLSSQEKTSASVSKHYVMHIVAESVCGPKYRF